MIYRICNSDQVKNTFSVNDKMFGGKEKFGYFECTNCGTLQIAEIPKDMSPFYPENYYSLNSTSILKDKVIEKIRDQIFYYNFPSFLVHKLSVKIPNLALEAFLKLKLTKSAKIIDVGCGEGKFLKSLHGLGFKNILGIDPFALKTTEKPFQIRKVDLSQITEKFDLITFNHVFEHVENVHETLQQCKKILNDGGKILIRVPVKDSFAYEFYGENWVQWDAPRHFHLLTKKAFQFIAEKNNLEIISYYNDSYKLQFTGSEKYLRNLSYQTSNAVFTSEEIQRYNSDAQNLNKKGQGDQVVVVLRSL